MRESLSLLFDLKIYAGYSFASANGYHSRTQFGQGKGPAGMSVSNRMQDLKPGDTARVVGLSRGDRGYRQRLLAMGVTPGVTFSITRVAPFGDPIEISVRNFTLTLRKQEAEILEIERV